MLCTSECDYSVFEHGDEIKNSCHYESLDTCTSEMFMEAMCKSEETTLRNLDLECPASRTRREVLFYKPPKLSHFIIGQSSQSNTYVYLIDKQINDKVTSIYSKLNF